MYMCSSSSRQEGMEMVAANSSNKHWMAGVPQGSCRRALAGTLQQNSAGRYYAAYAYNNLVAGSVFKVQQLHTTSRAVLHVWQYAAVHDCFWQETPA
jgi:hypothetical protein